MAEESKQSGLANGGSKSNRNISNASLEDNLLDLEESLEFDIYLDDIPLIAEASANISNSLDDSSIKNVIHFSDPGSDNSGPIPLNLSSFNEVSSDNYSDISEKSFSEDDLDEILLKDESDLDDVGRGDSESEEFSLDESYSSGNERLTADDLNDTYDTELDDEENITLGSDELDSILNPDEDDSENEYDGSSFFDSEPESDNEEESIALSMDELNNITDTDYAETEEFLTEQRSDLFTESSDEEISLSGDELNDLLESGELEGESEKSFFDSEEEDESIALSTDELSNITSLEYAEDDGIETEDLSSGIESNEFGVSTEGSVDDEITDEDDISLSSDELSNIIESGEMEIDESVDEEIDEDNVKSFFDSEEDDESIALSEDELGNITAEQDSDDESDDFESEAGNFDLSDSTEDLEMESESDLFKDGEDENEEISLSGDELNNLLESGEIEAEEDSSMGSALFENANEDDDDSISLSPDELGNITAEQDFEIDSMDSAEDSVAEEDNFDLFESTDDLEIGPSPDLFEETGLENEEIALSGDELSSLLESGELEVEDSESSGSSFFEDSEDDDSISLSADELGNITAEQDDEEGIESSLDSLSQEDNFDLSESTDDLNMNSSPDLFGESEDDEISLSGDELSNLLESGEIEMESEDANTDTKDNPIDSGMIIGGDDFVIEEDSSLSTLGDFDPDDSSLLESSNDYSDKLDSFQFGSVKKEELIKVISYMDELLGSLPDSYIKEFASSEYFELYKKIMKELEL